MSMVEHNEKAIKNNWILFLMIFILLMGVAIYSYKVGHHKGMLRQCQNLSMVMIKDTNTKEIKCIELDEYLKNNLVENKNNSGVQFPGEKL